MMRYSNSPSGIDNFILLGSVDSQRILAQRIVSEMKTRSPEKFEGNKDFISFELRYIAPFDKNFNELKRLQGTAAEAAGRRNEFRGYMIIDLSNYAAHCEDAYLDIALHFLIDMNDCWKYIFLIDNKHTKESRTLVSHILRVLLRDISCEVKEDTVKPTVKELLNSICKEQNIICSSGAKGLLIEILSEEVTNSDVVTGILRDIASRCGKRIDKDMLMSSIAKRESTVKYLINEKEYSRLMNIFEQQKEELYGEKEAV